MSKADRARKIAKKKAEAAGLPPLPEVREQKQDRDASGRFRKPMDDPSKEALNTRCRIMGWEETRANRAIVSAPMYGTDMGRCISQFLKSGTHASAMRAWEAYTGLYAADRAYRLLVIGVTGDPKGADIKMVPEPMEADQSHTVDVRDWSEKHADAVNRWERWQGYLGQIDASYAQLLRSVVRDTCPPLWQDAKATWDGTQALVALSLLADVVAVNGKRGLRCG